MIKKTLVFLSVLTTMVACKTASLSSRPSLVSQQTEPSYKANDEKITLQPQYVVFNVNDSVSELYFKFKSKQLLYTKRETNDFTSNCLIFYQLFNSYTGTKIIDSASLRLIDINNESTDKYLIGKIKVKTPSAKKSFLQITLRDINRNLSQNDLIEIDKTNSLTRQNFLVTTKTANTTLFRDYLKINENVTIQYKKQVSAKVIVSYYNRNFPLALPPFSTSERTTFSYKPDSIYSVHLSPKGTLDFEPTKKGFYHFQLDTSKRDGLTLFVFSNVNFPEIKKTEEMLYPLRYITSKEEYDNMESSTNLKSAIETFWINTTNDKEKTRTIIRKYYLRTQKANEHFTSYVEGWRSDRGMTYIVYGAPNSIVKGENYETWTYTDESSLSPITFSFVKVINPFTNNDYMLDRSLSYKQSWFSAVDVWRTGRAYYLDE